MKLRSLECRIPPPLLGVTLGALMWWFSDQGPRFPLPPTASQILAGLLLMVGLLLDLRGLLAFRAARTTINPLAPERSSTLVTDGVYRWTRNPMYLGMAMLLSAWALFLGAWVALAGPAAFVLYITRFQIIPEERFILARFGDSFTQYQSQVRRWI